MITDNNKPMRRTISLKSQQIKKKLRGNCDEGMGCGLKTHARSSPRLTPEVLSKRFFGRDEEYKEGGGRKK